jgi:hypothetical protein
LFNVSQTVDVCDAAPRGNLKFITTNVFLGFDLNTTNAMGRTSTHLLQGQAQRAHPG